MSATSHRSFQRTNKTEAVAGNGMVTAMHPFAAEAGIEILKRSGNAVDAAIAAALASGVVEPFMSGLGGALYALVYDAKAGVTRAFDGTALAPSEAREDMFALASSEEPRLGVYGWRATEEDESETGFRSVAVPGALAALEELHRAHASLSWEELVASAVRLAEEGFPVDEYFFAQTALSRPRLLLFPETARVFAKALSYQEGRPESLRHPEAARTLRLIARDGPRSFYEGEIAEEIISFMRAKGGSLSREDLAEYRASVSPPLRTSYRGKAVDLLGGTSGGPTVAHALRVLESFDLPSLAPDSIERLRILAEALRLAYRDRMQHGGQHTTHLNVADRDGNLVALTATLGARFGSGVMVPGCGVLLNNGMMWFDPEPGRVHSIQPRKPALHAAAPAIAFEGEAPILAVGSPGARKIMSAVLQVLLNILDHGMGIQDAIQAPRIHTEDRPPLLVESHFPETVPEGLRLLGHEVLVKQETLLSSWFGRPSGILVDRERGVFHGGVEPYRVGIALGY